MDVRSRRWKRSAVFDDKYERYGLMLEDVKILVLWEASFRESVAALEWKLL